MILIILIAKLKKFYKLSNELLIFFANYFDYRMKLVVVNELTPALSPKRELKGKSQKGHTALIFFGSLLYQDKKEHVKGSLQCFSIAMQWFTLVLWPMHGVYRCLYRITLPAINITPLRG
ncbi:MAG TPA: hypothetical protein ENN49_00320 [Bacteroidales bacterium]|nr:hypothetical protein [Bacteroidales bacterium]